MPSAATLDTKDLLNTTPSAKETLSPAACQVKKISLIGPMETQAKPSHTGHDSSCDSGSDVDADCGGDPMPQFLENEMDEQAPYPLDSLPGIIRDAVQEYAQYGQQPMSLIAGSALSATSFACQHLANVKRDAINIGPISLNMLIIAESGERKTSADNVFSRSIREWVDATRMDYSRKFKEASAQQEVWEIKTKACRETIKAATKDASKIKDSEMAEMELEKLCVTKPKHSKPPTILYSDVNAASLGQDLTDNYPSAALWSAEGMVFAGSAGMNKDNIIPMLGLLNTLWDNGEYENTRKLVDSVKIKGARLTVSLMMQNIIFEQMSQSRNCVARGSGNLARFLISRPTSTIGFRPYREPAEERPYMDVFNARITELLNSPFNRDENGRLAPGCLEMADDAKAAWVEFFDRVELNLKESEEYGTVRDFGSKSAENAARLAAIFHIMEHGPTGEIGAKAVTSACTLMQWYLDEALRVMNLQIREKQTSDLDALFKWIINEFDETAFSRRHANQNGPGGLRKGDVFSAVFDELERRKILIKVNVVDSPNSKMYRANLHALRNGSIFSRQDQD